MTVIDTSLLSGTNPAKSPGAAGTATSTPQAPTGGTKAVAPATPGSVSQSAATRGEGDAALERDQLARIAEELEHFLGGAQRGLSFHVDEATGRDVVVVKDIKNDQVIRQIPAEEVLELAARLSDLTGLLVKTEA
ncbi:flagellar protein FlaG [Ferrimonas balearica]|uniref:flagellar protein FlaG n=1 Tax=Ferrimonas balearica TaxID=44012 RepID=UPI001C990500|nr:flagellar protein FlaG [Ferrimonas balearica]MBY5990724.1 flagellar protein FlaG [Ferrimonas balearica]